MPTPRPLTRRRFLGDSTATALALSVSDGMPRTLRTHRALFQHQLPIPPVLAPTRRDADADYYDITQRPGITSLVPGDATTVWGYDGLWPGPTIRARRNRAVVVRQVNALDVATVVHLHGGATPPDSDGFPTDLIAPGDSRTYVYPNAQPAATLWYHDHAMDHTGRDIFMGLAGFYLLDDDDSTRLGLPSGEFDVPLLIQRRACDSTGALTYSSRRHLGAEGSIVTVNGAPNPRLSVSTHRYRFRLLNGSNATPLRLRLSNGAPLMVIANDAGLLPASVACHYVRLGMAERVEVVVDFAGLPVGTRVVLIDDDADGDARSVMCFDVARLERDDSSLPERLAPTPHLTEDDARVTRDFVFAGGPHGFPPSAHWRINGLDFDPGRPLATPRLNDVEVWRFTNHRRFGILGMLHTVHVHLVRFLILDRNGRPPEAYERGWKDTVALDPGDVVRIVARFEGHRGRYLMHCHNTEHEDASMMARYDVV